ncbi:MAG: hypothetical protein A3F67_09155 [Verrucomicrobia bacterium RIFCSPHIGHO2_12_FULL_41_10]|nr:MAG: hypothetical protein A3F67_09155 [Verrucomicrobia bacterium RIFCSPHIGHO2_12_FULL_41_10]HLB34574.1 hypothetical protein [Chthoniobacterales bacterium]
MSADYLTIRLEEGKDPEDFLKNLQSLVPDLKVSVQKNTPYGQRYRLYFEPVSLKAFSQVLDASKSLGIISVPNFMSACTLASYVPNDPRYPAQGIGLGMGSG